MMVFSMDFEGTKIIGLYVGRIQKKFFLRASTINTIDVFDVPRVDKNPPHFVCAPFQT